MVDKPKLLEGAPVTFSPFTLLDAAPAQQKFEQRSAGNESSPRV